MWVCRSANTAYEEAIIAAFNGSYDEALAHHDHSLDLAATAGERLHDIDAAYAMLLEDPLAPELEPDLLREELAGRVLFDVNAVLFDEVAEHIKVQNLVETFERERSRCALGRI